MQHQRKTRRSLRPSAGSQQMPLLDSRWWALALALMMVSAPAWTQVVPDSATQIFADGFELYTHSQSASWERTTTGGQPWWQWNQDEISSWTSRFFIYNIEPDYADGEPYKIWGEQHLCNLYGTPTNSSILIIRDSIPPGTEMKDIGGTDYDNNLNAATYNADDWTNFRIDVDIALEQLQIPGIIWAMTGADDTAFPPADKKPADGYIFWIDNKNSNGFPNSANCENAAYEPQWHLARIQGWDRQGTISGQQDWVELASGTITPKDPATGLPATAVGTNSIECFKTGRAFTFRLDWYCGNLRIQYRMPWNAQNSTPVAYYGCASALDADGICDETNKDDCWCLLEQFPMGFYDSSPIEDPGMVGLYKSGPWSFLNPDFDFKWDNVEVATFGATCGLVCGPWSGWAHERTDTVPFKFLYEGSLFDFSAGRSISPNADRGKIDVKTEAPASVSAYNHSTDSNPYCNGWNLLADLPSPTGSTNIADIQKFLEPMSSAVGYDHSTPAWDTGTDWWNPPDDPMPMVADGSTPINSSLLEAYDWYVAQRTTGAWATDPYEGCRQWYVILITDGEEACEPGNPDAVCDPGGGAVAFANADATDNLDPLPVYTIGFSESVEEDSPLKCIAEETGGLFLTAENASQLSDALYEVFYRLEGASASFSPYKVAPPPAGSTGNPTRDYLAVFPFFTPQDGQTLWAGNLWAFPLNANQPTLPTTGDCEVDTTFMAWNAYDALEEQLDDHTEANPHRFVYMGSDSSGSWVRHDLATTPTNATLMAEFKTLLDVSGGVTDVVAQQIVNFVRNIRVDNDADPSNPGPPAEARPSGYPVLGDFFHSQPVVVNPPNNPTYFYNVKYPVTGEVGAHNYSAFMTQQAKRRRIVLAGANDGMLHAFDGGFWDRDRVDTTETYNEIHDLGTGTELFAWVPQAVMDRLWSITSGGSLNHTVGLDMVDGPIVTGDAFIDYNGDSNREWRTVALTSMRRGGRGIVALDITQPDPTNGSPDYVPTVSEFPGCRDGGSGCQGEYPRLMWEFSDTSDDDTNGQEDLGWTWSKPAIARIAVYNSSVAQQPNDIFVAFFGGGWDKNESDQTGNYFYGVNLETGAVIVKEAMSVDLPGGVTALDSDVDGFHDRIYFADSDGGIWRLEYPAPTDSAATGAAAGGASDPGTFTRIWDLRGLPDRQEFFTRPIPVPAISVGDNFVYALALGSGDRAELDREDSGIDHLYFVLDMGDTTTRDEGDLVSVDYTDLDGDFDCTTNALNPTGGDYGWYLGLRDSEKTVNDAVVVNGYVFFATFDPSTDTPTHNVPNECVPEGESNPIEIAALCQASGIGRSYKLWYECGLGDYREYDDIITGLVPNNASGSTKVGAPGSGDGGGGGDPDEWDTGQTRQHRITNWRQE